jgi:hypothetical protein
MPFVYSQDAHLSSSDVTGVFRVGRFSTAAHLLLSSTSRIFLKILKGIKTAGVRNNVIAQTLQHLFFHCGNGMLIIHK